jgi:lipopolysaccharide/colanic/teichoic acid biosynthesis glycosyltransferase
MRRFSLHELTQLVDILKADLRLLGARMPTVSDYP